jgi:hypothetical protein
MNSKILKHLINTWGLYDKKALLSERLGEKKIYG